MKAHFDEASAAGCRPRRPAALEEHLEVADIGDYTNHEPRLQDACYAVGEITTTSSCSVCSRFSPGQHAPQHAMPQADVVDALGDGEARAFHQRLEMLGPVHAAVAIGHGREVERGGREREGACLEALPVDEGLHDPERGARAHGRACFPKDRHHFLLTEAVEELAHPDGIGAGGQGARRVEHVGGVRGHACAHARIGDVALQVAQLAGQVHGDHAHLGVVAQAGQAPFPIVGAHVHDHAWFLAEDDLQRDGVGAVGVVVVELEPALPHSGGQVREALVYGGPIAEHLQASGLAFADRFFEVGAAGVAHLVHEVEVHARHLIEGDHVAGLREAVAIAALPDEAGGERHVDEHPEAVARDPRGGDQLGFGGAHPPGLRHGIEQADAAHGLARLEQDGPEGDALGLGARISCRGLSSRTRLNSFTGSIHPGAFGARLM